MEDVNGGWFLPSVRRERLVYIEMSLPSARF